MIISREITHRLVEMLFFLIEDKSTEFSQIVDIIEWSSDCEN